MIRQSGLDYDVEFTSRPERSHRFATAVWCSDAAIVIRCLRCSRSLRCVVPASEIQCADPNNNHCLGSMADGLIWRCPTAAGALESLADHPC